MAQRTFTVHGALRPCFWLAVGLFVLAAVAYYFHAVDLNPQYDTQGIRYAGEWNNALSEGKFWSWFLEPPARKYPTFFIAPFAILEQLFHIRTLLEAHLITRAVILLYGLGTFIVLQRIAFRLYGDSRRATLLLMSSVTFFMFMTAVRPHIEAAFWTLLTFSLSLSYRERPTLMRAALTFASAAMAVGVLQSGFFAFIFPVFAIFALHRDRRKWPMPLGIGAAFFIFSIVINYPVEIVGMLSSSQTTDLSMGHEIGFSVLPFLIPQKLWAVFVTEIILCIIALLGMREAYREQRQAFLPVFLYLVVYIVIFGMQPITSIRFFLPLFPFLALIGGLFLRRHPTLECVIAVICILMYAKLGLLALQPNTLQQASTFVNAQGQPGRFMTKMPAYFLNIEEKQYAQHPSVSGAMILLQSQEHNAAVESLPLCGNFVAITLDTVSAGVDYMFFWHEVKWPLYYLFNTKALGRNLRLYCAP